MFISKKHISRRAVLRGAGVALSLPLLDSMIPAQTPLSKTAAVPKTRFMGIFCPHGMAPGYWIPEKETLDPKNLSFILKPLEQVANRTVILSGLWSKSAEPPPGVTGADHWVAAAYLCANKPKKTTGSDILDGVTIDQLERRAQDLVALDHELACLPEQFGVERAVHPHVGGHVVGREAGHDPIQQEHPLLRGRQSPRASACVPRDGRGVRAVCGRFGHSPPASRATGSFMAALHPGRLALEGVAPDDCARRRPITRPVVRK